MKFPQLIDKKELKALSPSDALKRLASSRDGLSSEVAEQRLQHFGPNELSREKKSALRQFLGYFWGPIPWMIEVAAILSIVVQHWVDFGIIVVLLAFNSVVGFWEEHQAQNAVEKLQKNLAPNARVKRDGHFKTIEARGLVPGDWIKIHLGQIIPADLMLAEGDYLSIDQSALTGESVAVNRKTGDLVYSGSVVKGGEMEGLVVATGEKTYLGQTASLVRQAKSESHFQKAILSVGRYLIYLSLGLVAILLGVGFFRHLNHLELVQFALILTVASIPVAMPAVLSVTMAAGAMALSKMKAIVTKLESIEEMAGIDVLCSDKTGTLTKNQLTVGDLWLAPGKEEDELLRTALQATREDSDDAIDGAIIEAAQKVKDKSFEQQSFVPFDPVHKRTEATIQSGGETFKATKGAPQVILKLCHETSPEGKQTINRLARSGYRALGVARTDANSNWIFLGLIPLLDPPRDDARETLKNANEHGISVKMVTGDNVSIAREIASQLGLGTNILPADELKEIKDDSYAMGTDEIEKAHGYAEVFPEHKYTIIKDLQAHDHLVGMTGDGVNDAPALKQADVGIAVSGATDAARSASDLVLTAPGLSVIIRAVEEARRIFARMTSYTVYRITETIRIMFFMVAAMIYYGFYPITAVMIILLALLNDFPIMAIAYDNTKLQPHPVRWDMRKVLGVASVLGTIGLFETFILLYIARSIYDISLPELQSLIFLKLVIAGHLTLLVARTKNWFFTKPYPSAALFLAILGTQIVAALIVGLGLFVTPLPWHIIGWIWLYCLVWIFIEDAAKRLAYHYFDKRRPWTKAVPTKRQFTDQPATSST